MHSVQRYLSGKNQQPCSVEDLPNSIILSSIFRAIGKTSDDILELNSNHMFFFSFED